MPMTQTTSIKKDSVITTLTFIESNRKASWETHGSGHAGATFSVHDKAGWLSIVSTEYGSKTSRTTCQLLKEPAARALYAMLHEQFNPTPSNQPTP
jgi:hypothetical protein